MALLNCLARLTGGDPGRMYTVFQESGLLRDKTMDHPTYLPRTIQKAIAGLGWHPSSRGDKAPGYYQRPSRLR